MRSTCLVVSSTTLLTLAAATAAPATARADDLELGAAIAFKTDGVTDPTSETFADNIGTNRLYYAPVTAEVARRIAGGELSLWVHGSAGLGLLTGLDSGETSGSIFDAMVGPEVRWCPSGGRLCLGLGLDAGVSHARYAWNEHDYVTTSFVVEPQVTGDVRLSDRMSLRLAVGGRVKWLLGGTHEEGEMAMDIPAESEPIVGYSTKVALLWAF